MSLQLFILRHGKAETLATTDFDRALDPRGILQTQALAQRLPTPGPSDVALVSSAVRTRQTAENLLKGWGIDNWPSVFWEEKGYLAPARFWLERLSELPKGTGNVYIVGHNPGVSDLIDLLMGPLASLTYLRTAEGIHLVMDLPDWKYLATGTASLLEAFLR